jgi:hypothetical protein
MTAGNAVSGDKSSDLLPDNIANNGGYPKEGPLSAVGQGSFVAPQS